MVRFTVHTFGEHIIDNMQVSGPFKEIISEMTDMFFAMYQGAPEDDLYLKFAEHVISISGGQGQILEYVPNDPPPTH